MPRTPCIIQRRPDVRQEWLLLADPNLALGKVTEIPETVGDRAMVANSLVVTTIPCLVRLNDEYGNGDPDRAHFRYYIHLFDNLGIPRSEFFDYNEGPEIRLALSLAYNISEANDSGLAIGYMLVNDGM